MALSFTGTPTVPVIGSSFSFTPVISGGTAPYTVTSSAALPEGYTLDATTGAISATSVPAGKVSVTLTVTDSASTPATATLPVSFTPVAALSLTAVTKTGYTGTALTVDPTVTGGSGTKSYTISAGSLPAGLSIAADTGIISGTPTDSGSFPFTVEVADASGETTASYTLTIYKAPQIVNDVLPVGEVGVALTWTPNTQYGDGSDISVTIDSSTLPAGLTATAAGVISGTPTTAGSSEISATVTDGTNTSTQTVSATIIAEVALSGTAPKGYVISTYEFLPIVASGKPPYVWTVSALPKGLSFDQSTGAITGTFSGPGSYPISISVTDSLNGTSSIDTTIVVEEALPLLYDIPGYMQNTPVSYVFSANDVSSSATYAVGGRLPAGLVYDATTATLSGTPTESGSFPLTITITDGSTVSYRVTNLVVTGGMIPPGESVHPLDVQFATAVDVFDNYMATDLTSSVNQALAANQLLLLTKLLLRGPTTVAFAIMWGRHIQYSTSLFGNALFQTILSNLPSPRDIALLTEFHGAFHSVLTQPASVVNLDTLLRLTRQPHVIAFLENKMGRLVG